MLVFSITPQAFSFVLQITCDQTTKPFYIKPVNFRTFIVVWRSIPLLSFIIPGIF